MTEPKYKQYKPFYDPKITRPNKKYSVYVANNRLIHFGARNYQHYKDRTGQKKWSRLNHLDKERRRRYRARHKAIKLKDGSLAYKNKNQPSYYSYHYLW